jgi:hypothetical protein
MDDVSHPVRRPLDEILRISYEDLVKLAEYNMPFNFAEFFMNILIKPFQWFFSLFSKKMDEALTNALSQKKQISEWLSDQKKPKHKPNESYVSLSDVQKSTKNSKVNTESLEELIRSLKGAQPLDEVLKTLADKWNKTLSPQAKQDNFDLVHGKILNRLRFLKHIDASTVQHEVSNIMRVEKFVEKIHNKDAFRAYLTLWMANTALHLQSQPKKK